jgi:hypothetical protein
MGTIRILGGSSAPPRDAIRWRILAIGLLCLGTSGCQSYRTVPDLAPVTSAAEANAPRDIEALADEYLSALLDYRPGMGTF